MIDFTPVFTEQRKIAELSPDITLAALKATTDAQIDAMLNRFIYAGVY